MSTTTNKGYILHEDDLRVTIATMKTTNGKTGNMVQIWILAKDTEPHTLVKNKQDDIVCGNCPLRGGNGCYVTVHQAPLSIYRAYKRGLYSNDYEEFLSILGNKTVRFGAYGDPSFIPFNILFQIANRCKAYTGYTHQWNNKGFDTKYLSILTASIDNEKQIAKLEAKTDSFSYFRLVNDYSEVKQDEIICDSDLYGTQCTDCLKCNGSSNLKIVIQKHGNKANKIKVA